MAGTSMAFEAEVWSTLENDLVDEIRRIRRNRWSGPYYCNYFTLTAVGDCLLSGENRTWRLHCEMSANDHKADIGRWRSGATALSMKR